MLRVHPSNRLEVLAAGLAELMRGDPLPPLEPEVVVVPSSAVGRWLGFRLASALGIAANVRTEFAAAFVWRLIRRVLPEVPETSPLEPEALRWRLAARLAGPRGGDAAFAPVSRYLASGTPVQRFELAAAVAEAFDGYLVQRPHWIDAWSRGRLLGLGGDEAWQATLWRELAAGLPDPMRGHPRERFFDALARNPALRERLPRRIHLFAVTALPPLYFAFLQRLAAEAGVAVHVHAFNPCRQYWGLIVRRRELVRAEVEGSAAGAALEVGHALLASLGHHGRPALDALAEHDPGDAALYAEPGRGTVLAHLQSDILDLEETAGTAAADDDSVAVHVCHGPMREVEVLHDRLLDLLERDPALEPSDILVLMPDVDAYAPSIEAVFATAPERRRMPFAIADRGLAASAIARTLRLLLALPASRMDAEAVIAPLECAAVGRRFGIAPDELDTVRDWLREAGVRWGRDAASLAALGLPAQHEHTWRAGLARVLLGRAMIGEGTHMHAGVLPYDAVEGSAAALAGRLKSYADEVFALADDLQRPRGVRDWRRRLDRLLETFFEPDEDEAAELVALREALARVAANAAGAEVDQDVPPAVIEREWFAAAGEAARPQAFLGHGITFAALRSGRVVPARLVVLLGMNDGAYPRQRRAPGFDLAARRPEPGDRVRRDEDRYAFLEALLAARERLWLFHTGRSARDNEAIPPSPLVAELLDAVRRAFGEDAARSAVIEHPLQPFSRRLYEASGAGGFSYADAWVPPPVRHTVPPFLAAPLPEPPLDQWALLRVEDLQRLLRNPAQVLLRDRLRIQLEESEGLLPGTEPFVLDGLERHALRRQVFGQLCAGVAAEDALALARASGRLPAGAPGEVVFRDTLDAVQPLAERWRGEARTAPVVVDLALGAHRLTGAVSRGEAFEPAALSPPRRLAAWVRHLVVNAVDGPQATALHALDGSLRLAPLDAAAAHARLAELAALHRRALTEPLRFFPRTSWAYAERVHAGADDGLKAAHRAWTSDRQHGQVGEDADPYFALAFRHLEHPLDEAFTALATAVCLPLLAAGEDAA